MASLTEVTLTQTAEIFRSRHLAFCLSSCMLSTMHPPTACKLGRRSCKAEHSTYGSCYLILCRLNEMVIRMDSELREVRSQLHHREMGVEEALIRCSASEGGESERRWRERDVNISALIMPIAN